MLPYLTEGDFMFSYVWPLGLVVLSNTLYQICAKEVPEKINPFASLMTPEHIYIIILKPVMDLSTGGITLMAIYQALENLPPTPPGIIK